MKKKTVVKLSLVLCLLLCMSLVACDNDVKDETHKAKSEWSSNETEHWHDCATEGCTEKFEKAAHAGVAEITTKPSYSKPGEQKRVCSVCGYEEKITLAALKPTSEKGNTYKQSKFVVEWESDEVKNAVLENLSMTEDQFKQFYNDLDMTIIFIAGDQVLVNAPGYKFDDDSTYSKNLVYSISDNGTITFYENSVEKESGKAFKDGLLGYTFVISSDYTTIGISSSFSDTGKTKCEIVLTIV